MYLESRINKDVGLFESIVSIESIGSLIKLPLSDEQGASRSFPPSCSKLKKSEGRGKICHAIPVMRKQAGAAQKSKMGAHHVPPGQSAGKGGGARGREGRRVEKKKSNGCAQRIIPEDPCSLLA